MRTGFGLYCIIALFTQTLVLWPILCDAQTCPKCIEAKKGFGGGYLQSGRKMSASDLDFALGQFPESKAGLAKAKTNNVASMIFGGIGGALIGWPIGTAIAGKQEPLWALAGVGAGVVALSIPFTIGHSKNMRKAVDAYNVQVGETGR